jgi:hypothetical protein
MDSEQKYSKWIDKYSVLALKLVGISLLLLFLLQGLLQIETVRTLIVPTEYWEGKPLPKP